MKHSLAVVAMTTVMMIGCASYQGIYDRDAVHNAALQIVGLEQVAWTSHNASKLPAGMESVVSLNRMSAHIGSIDVKGDSATVLATYWYNGTFSTPQGERAGTMKVERRLQFIRGSSGQWTQSAPPVEIARNASWKETA